ncbi:hypothetical protein H0H93_008218, partial [Arthromyces matolae]
TPPTQIGQQPHIRAPSRLGYSAIPQGPPPSSDPFNGYYTGPPPSQYGPAQIGQSYASTQIGQQPHSRAPSRLGYSAIPQDSPPSSDSFNSYYTSTRHSAVPTYQDDLHPAPSPYSMSYGPYDVDPNISGALPTYPQYSNPAILGNHQYGPAIPPIPLHGPHVNNVAPKMSFIAGPSAPLPSTLLWERAGYVPIPSDFLSGELYMSVPTVDNPEGYNAMFELLGSIVSTAPQADLSNTLSHLRNNYKFSHLYKISLNVVPVDPQNMFAFKEEVKEKLDQYNRRFVPEAKRDDRQWEPQPFNNWDAASLAMKRRKKPQS